MRRNSNRARLLRETWLGRLSVVVRVSSDVTSARRDRSCSSRPALVVAPLATDALVPVISTGPTRAPVVETAVTHTSSNGRNVPDRSTWTMSWAEPLDDCTVIVGSPANPCRARRPCASSERHQIRLRITSWWRSSWV